MFQDFDPETGYLRKFLSIGFHILCVNVLKSMGFAENHLRRLVPPEYKDPNQVAAASALFLLVYCNMA
jgi:hypothetical protein